MAKSKTKASKKAGTNKKAAAKKAGAVATKPAAKFGAPPVAEGAVAALLARLPALDDEHRDAFASQFTDAECVVEGATTKSGAVRAAAVAWASEAVGPLTDASLASEIDYAATRLTWLVELVARLDAARGALPAKESGGAAVRTTRDVAREKAKALRDRLGDKLGRVLRGDPSVAATIAGAARNDEELAGSLRALAGATESALGKHVALSVAANLTAADASAARAAAGALEGSRDDVVLGGRATGGRDTPAVNLIEGRIVFEMRFLRDAFDAARGRGQPVPALMPPSGLLHALAKSHRAKGSGAATSAGGAGSSGGAVAKAGPVTTPA